MGFSGKAEWSEGSMLEEEAEGVTRKSVSQQTKGLAANRRELQSDSSWVKVDSSAN